MRIAADAVIHLWVFNCKRLIAGNLLETCRTHETYGNGYVHDRPSLTQD
jgi:hypothetical protein